MVTCRSKRPGRNSAGSSTSGRFVAAITIIPSIPSKPSISTSNWLRVCSRSSFPPPIPEPRLPPTASISSMKIIHGAFCRPCSNISRTLLAPTPTNISTKSEPLILKKGTSASPATAFASKVFPVPGDPDINIPLGILPPSFRNLAGSFRNSTVSLRSSFASSIPATSSKVTFISSGSIFLARLRPIENNPPPVPPDCILLISTIQIPKIKMNGPQLIKMLKYHGRLFSGT